MNPNIDLGSFKRGSAAAVIAAPGSRPGALVSPPRRVLTRFLLPSLLLMGFAGVGLYAVRGSIQPTVPVRITLPMAAPAEAAIADVETIQEPGMTTHGESFAPPQPSELHNGLGPNMVYTIPRKGEQLFQAPGWIEPEPYKRVVAGLQTGQIKALHVLEGQRVTSGALLAELVGDDARLAVQQAEATLALKRAQLEAASSEWQNPVSLTEVIQTSEAEAAKLKAEKAKAEAKLELSTKEAAAGQSLSRSGYEAGLENFRRQSERRIGQSELEETNARLRQNEATLSASRERLRLRVEDRLRVATALAEQQEAEAKLAEARLRLERTKIRAQQDGVIMQVHVSPGSTLMMEESELGMQVATMYDPEQLQVRVDVPVNEAAKLRPGLPAEVRVDALPDKVFEGVLTRIVPLADVQRNVLPVKVHLFSPGEVLHPEMLAKVQFFAPAKAGGIGSQPKNNSPAPSAYGADLLSTQALSANAKVTVLVPEDVLHDVKEGTATVWVAGPDSRATLRSIRLGGRREKMRVVTEGVQVADRLIASNAERLRDNIRIRIVKEPQ